MTNIIHDTPACIFYRIVVSFDVNQNVNHSEGFYTDSEEKQMPEGTVG